MNIEIFVEDNSDIIDLDSRGYCSSIYVKRDNKYYNIFAVCLTRLMQDIDRNNNMNRIYTTEPNLVILKDTLKDTLIQTLIAHDNMFFYEKLKECNVIENKIMYQMSETQIKSALNNNLPISFEISKLYKIN